jgi:AMMECR1 domain-containing protein
MSHVLVVLRPSLFLLAAVLLASLGGCSSGSGDTEGDVVQLGEEIAFSLAPLPDNGHLALDVRLQAVGGGKASLSDLVGTRSLVVYMNTDYKDRQNRAATRMLEPLIEVGGPLGFAVVVIFEAGSSWSDIERWQEKRRMEEAVVAVDSVGAFAEASGWALRSAALVDSGGRIGVKFEPSERWDSRNGFEPALTSDILALAWTMPDTGPAISDSDMAAAVDTVRHALRTLAKGGKPEGVGEGALTAPIDHPVYVSLYRPGTTERLRGGATSGSLEVALAVATESALRQAKDGGQEWKDRVEEIRFQVDLLGATQVLPSVEEKPLWHLIEPGVHGLVVREGDKRSVMLPSEAVTEGLLSPRVRARPKKHAKIFARLSKQLGASRTAWSAGELEIERFRTTAFGVATPDGPAVRMFRGNVLGKAELTEADILRSIRIGGQWLVNTVGPEGKFDYEYFPSRDRHSPGYNIVRHAGSVYGLFEMFELAGSEPALAEDRVSYIEAASRAMSYVYDAMRAPREGKPGRVCLLDERGGCDSGSAALTLLTFLVRPPKSEIPAKLRSTIYRKDDSALMEGLGRTLLDMIDEDGKVFRRYSESLRLDKVKREPPYYPGETMLALMRFYEASGDTRWLEGARKIADRQVAHYERKRFRVPDHWVMQAYWPLWQVTKDEKYVTSAYAMAKHYTSELYGFVWAPWPDYAGAWRRVDDLPRTTRAGSRSEALRAVVNMGWERGDDMTIHEDALLAAARHLDEQQFSERNSYWLPNPEEAYGAYPMGLVDNHCRIDNNQHALVGMVGALHVARRRAAKAAPPAEAAGDRSVDEATK